MSLQGGEVNAMKRHYEQLVDGLNDEKKELEVLMVEKEKKLEHERKEFERGREDSREIVGEKERQIEELKHRLAATGQASDGEMGTLQKTLNKLSD